MTVVKADAYGHGLKPIAARLMQSGTDISAWLTWRSPSYCSVGKAGPILMRGLSA